MTRATIHIVEDEAIIAMELEGNLQHLGYRVTSITDNAEDSISQAVALRPDLVLMDIRIKGEPDGIAAAEMIRRKLAIPVIFITAYLDEERIERSKFTMPFGYLLKPIQERDLKVSIEMALHISRVEAERRKIEERMVKIFNTTSNYMALLEVTPSDCFRFVSINEAYRKGILLVNPEISADDIEGLNIEALGELMHWPREVAEGIVKTYKEAIATKMSVSVIDIVPTFDSEMYLESTYSPIFDTKGNCTHILFVSNDITKWKKTEKALRQLLEEKEAELQQYKANAE